MQWVAVCRAQDPSYSSLWFPRFLCCFNTALSVTKRRKAILKGFSCAWFFSTFGGLGSFPKGSGPTRSRPGEKIGLESNLLCKFFLCSFLLILPICLKRSKMPPSSPSAPTPSSPLCPEALLSNPHFRWPSLLSQSEGQHHGRWRPRPHFPARQSSRRAASDFRQTALCKHLCGELWNTC